QVALAAGWVVAGTGVAGGQCGAAGPQAGRYRIEGPPLRGLPRDEVVEAAVQYHRERAKRNPGPAAQPCLRRQRALPLRARRLPGGGHGHEPNAAVSGRVTRPPRAQPAACHESPAAAGPDVAGTAAGWGPRKQDALSLVGPQPGQGEDGGGLPERGGGRRRPSLRRADARQLGALGDRGEVDETAVGVGTLSAAARSAQGIAPNSDPVVNRLR